MYLTSKNDYKTLEFVLNSDAARERRANWKDNNEDSEEKNNPILVSVQQDYKKCTKLLYQNGYRIPQTLQDTGDNSFPGEDEHVRYARVISTEETYPMSMGWRSDAVKKYVKIISSLI